MPEAHEDMAPDFEHHKQAALPHLQDTGVSARLILGSAYGETSPVTMLSETFYLDVQLEPGASFPLPDDHEDRGVYVTQGSVEIAGDRFDEGRMMVFRPGDKLSVTAGALGARLMLLGGATLNEDRYIWWNFVSSSKEKIETATREWKSADWAKGAFHLPPGDDQEFIPISKELGTHQTPAGRQRVTSGASGLVSRAVCGDPFRVYRRGYRHETCPCRRGQHRVLSAGPCWPGRATP